MPQTIPREDMLPLSQQMSPPPPIFSSNSFQPLHRDHLHVSPAQSFNQVHHQSQTNPNSQSRTFLGPSSQPLNVVITGGSSGIGAATVHTFAKAGHRVMFTYRSGRGRAEQLNAIYPTCTTYFPLDQADIYSVANFSKAVSDWAGSHGVDVLINNAALGSATVDNYVEQVSTVPSTVLATNNATSLSNKEQTQQMKSQPELRQSFSKCTLKMMERAAHSEALIKVNALGPLYVTQALEEELHKAAYETPDSKAVVIFIGSVGGGSTAVFPEYCAADLMSKAAMTYLSKHIAAKYVQEPIDVMCISPGATETDMFRESTLDKLFDPERFIRSMPKRRLIKPEDIASTILWLSTECPKGIFHGANLDASMGLATRPGLQTETEHSR